MIIDHKIRCLCCMPRMLHVRTSQLIIAGDGCGIQGDFFPGAWQWKKSEVMLMKIFGLTNKSDRMSTKKNVFHESYVVFLCICSNIRNMKCTVIRQARFHLYCINTNVHIPFFSMYY